MEQATRTNGIDVQRLLDTIETVKGEPEAAKFKFRAQNKWVYGSHACSEIKGFSAGGEEDAKRPYRFIFHADEPDALLGTDYGPNPVETVLHALCSCVGSALVFYASLQGIKIDSLEFEAEGNLDARGFLGVSPDVRRGFQDVHITCRISADAPQSKLQELVDLGKKYSPVYDIVTNGVPVTITTEGQEVRAAM